MSRDPEASKKELESMVMKYAKSEKEVIWLKKCKEDLERKLRDAVKEKEAFQFRVKGLTNDKASLIISLDKKLAESASQLKEIERLKEDLRDRDAKWKTALSKLNSEADAHVQCQQRLNATLLLMSDLKQENDQLRRELQKRQVIDDDNNQSRAEEESYLGIHYLFETESEKEMRETQFRDQQNALKEKLCEYEKTNELLAAKIKDLETQKQEREQHVTSLTNTLELLQQEVKQKDSEINELRSVEESLKSSEEVRLALLKEVERLFQVNSELTGNLELVTSEKEELISVKEQLTRKIDELQDDLSSLQHNLDSLTKELKETKQSEKAFREKGLTLEEELKELKDKYENEVSLLVRKVAEKTKIADDLKIKVDELSNEAKVIQRRHMNSVKELNKELLVMKKRLEAFESQKNGNNNDQQSIGSRTSSSTSLEACVQSNGVDHQTTTESLPVPTPDQLPELDSQMLVCRIIKLQKTLARKQEKIDFLEEHNQQLLEEVKRKSKIIQQYVLREESGALTTNKMDENKPNGEKEKVKDVIREMIKDHAICTDLKRTPFYCSLTQRQLARFGGGVMASLYGSSPTDSTISLELSLEINKKLQAVLEDTILKNITLKENINTLGDEIERLKSKASCK